MTIQKTSKKQTSQPAFVGQSVVDESPDDFVAYLYRVMVRVGVKVEMAGQVAEQVTSEWGGDRAYIAKRVGAGRSERNDAIRRDHRRGESIALICRRYQLSRQHVYRILGLEEKVL